MHTADSEAIYFHEVQRCRQWWLWVPVISTSVFIWMAFIMQILFGVSAGELGDNPVPDWLIIVLFVLFGICTPWLVSSLALTTDVRTDAVYVRFFPFHPHWIRISPEVIANATAGTYRHMGGFHGLWILRGHGGFTYYVSGNKGVRLELVNNRHLIIGSQRAEDPAEAVQQMLTTRSAR